MNTTTDTKLLKQEALLQDEIRCPECMRKNSFTRMSYVSARCICGVWVALDKLGVPNAYLATIETLDKIGKWGVRNEDYL